MAGRNKIDKIRSLTAIGVLVLSIAISKHIVPVCLAGGDKIEVKIDQAISIAIELAKKDNYNTEIADVEVLRFKGDLEKGPIRAVLISDYFFGMELEGLLQKDFWLIYLYPRGQLESPRFLGGDFYAFIDLYSGEVLASFAGQ
jgi:hypothetical protein